MKSVLFLLLVNVSFCWAKFNTNQVDDHSVIVHLFEWKYSDIAVECERWLGPKGFGAVQVSVSYVSYRRCTKYIKFSNQISPANEHLIFKGRPWWERYQPLSYEINTRSGDESDFLNMTRRCNANGVRIYADVVLNHMAGENPEPIIGTDGAYAYPDRYEYPSVPYSKQHFNKPCSIELWNDADQLRNCEISGLRDLNLTQEYVRETIVDYLNKLIRLGVSGFRIDSAKYMWPTDLEAIYSRLDNLNVDFGFSAGSRAFMYHEVVDYGSQSSDVGRWEYIHLGKVTDFMLAGEIGRAFRGYNALKYLKNWGPQWNFMPSEFAIVFADEHEIQRGYGYGGDDALNYRDPKLHRMATAFLLAHPHGQPRIMSSYQFRDPETGPPQDMFENIVSPVIQADGQCNHQEIGWNCEHRWPTIGGMVEFRNEVSDNAVTNWWDNGHSQIGFSRGEKGFIVWNGDKFDVNRFMQTCLPAGVYCDVATGGLKNGQCNGKSVVVDEMGMANIRVSKDSFEGVFAIHTGSTLE